MTQQVNLIDASLLPPRRLLTARSMLVAWAAGSLFVLSHLAWERNALRNALVVEPAASSAESNPQAVPATEGDAAMQRRIVQSEALRQMLRRSGQAMPDGAALLRQVIAALPESMWLTQIDIAGTQAIRIAGGTTDPKALTDFADRLARIPALRGVPIEAVRIEPQEANAGGGDGAAATPAHHNFVLASAQATGEENR